MTVTGTKGGSGGTASAAAPTRALRREDVSARRVSVAVLVGDPLTGEGLVAHLRARSDMTVLDAEHRHEAEVVLIVVDQITEDTIGLVERVAGESSNGNVRFVLVGEEVREQHFLRGVTSGLVSVIPRREADFDRICRAIADAREGRFAVPDVTIGWLVRRLRAIHQDVLEPNGLTAAGLDAREVDVISLLAEGLSTAEIAQQLSYSERTVKNVIHDLLVRLKLRNRAHAVAFAMRTGAL